MSEGIKLCTRLVGDITGDFLVKSYQRGYRWGKEEVTRLLDDIYSNGQKNYCLQPIVVGTEENQLELIDGQQRLTTLYLIYKVMNDKSRGFLNGAKFTIDYETRPKSKEFLQQIDVSQKNNNIDFFFLSEAYETIYNWFSDREQSVMTKFNEYLDDHVRVIWYEVDDSVKPIELFTRLNIGKIALTSAELVKAMFLSRDINSEMTRERQEEIALQWDNIEKELHNEELWYFLTNSEKAKYQTRIDLILDLVSGKSPTNKEKYFTFFEIDKLSKTKELEEVWKEIQHTFLIVKDWFENHELYHKVGYLITSNYKTLSEIYELSQGKTKKEFIQYLDKTIASSIHINCNYGELNYKKTGDYEKISRLLLLFNIESVRKNGEQTEWFPFSKFKSQKDGKRVWSLEHIHAQQSEGMQTIELWKEWLRLHISSIKAIDNTNEELIQKMEHAIEDPKLDGNRFAIIQTEVVERLSTKGNVSYMHSIANLALLNSQDNAALNNSTFDVKRNRIIEMDQNGQYIPFCTKMVFLKYYTKSNDNQLHFWGEEDMKAYINHMNFILEGYLGDNKIIIEEEITNDEYV